MSKIVWDAIGERRYETGVDHGVLYLYDKTAKAFKNGVAWNGLTSVQETPSGAESNPQYADNIKYLDLISAEQFGATVECFTYPDEWEKCDGSASPVDGMSIRQQERAMFGLCYRTKIGNDVESDAGYKLHLVYNCKASTSERQYQTVNDSPEALSFSYEISTTPIDVPDYKQTSIITIDSTKFVEDDGSLARLQALELKLYGGDDTYEACALPLSAFESGVDYYTKSGDVYTKVADTSGTPDSATQYYTAVSHEPYLPLPAEVITTLRAANNG